MHETPQLDSWAAAVNPALIARYTRHWIHYGAMSFVVLCVIIGALRGIAGH
jgi:hypothetical protein